MLILLFRFIGVDWSSLQINCLVSEFYINPSIGDPNPNSCLIKYIIKKK